MSIIDFFDVYDYLHIQAWATLQTTGMWPEDFVPDGTDFPPMWRFLIESKMADAWFAMQLDRDI